MKSTDHSRTAAYYAEHAQEYFEQTNDLDMGAVYEPFESRLKPGSLILDLGCGSGRDARHFAARGYSVVALDPCRELLALAARNTPDELRDRIRFVVGAAPRFGFGENHFDAIWACASLLHLARNEMIPALMECRRVLQCGGLLFLAVKSRDESEDFDQRDCTIWDASELRRVVSETLFEVIRIGEVDSLDGRAVNWINLLAKRT